MEMTDKRVSELEGESIQMIQSEDLRTKHIKKKKIEVQSPVG